MKIDSSKEEEGQCHSELNSPRIQDELVDNAHNISIKSSIENKPNQEEPEVPLVNAEAILPEKIDLRSSINIVTDAKQSKNSSRKPVPKKLIKLKKKGKVRGLKDYFPDQKLSNKERKLLYYMVVKGVIGSVVSKRQMKSWCKEWIPAGALMKDKKTSRKKKQFSLKKDSMDFGNWFSEDER